MTFLASEVSQFDGLAVRILSKSDIWWLESAIYIERLFVFEGWCCVGPLYGA
ncbi:MAG: hypothetical protein AAGH38_01850 [Pseudomonadota bacterium]